MNFRIIEIFLNAHSSLYTDIAGIVKRKYKIRKIALFDILPGVIALLFVYNSNTIDKNSDLINYLLLTCSIFSGLLFSLMIVIVDKAKRMKEIKDETKEGEFYHLKKYLRFSRQLITKISFTILISLLIIILISCIKFSFGIEIEWLTKSKIYVVSFLIYYFSVQFLILIINIISDMYDVFKEEIG
jgi:hypothetical protein